MLEKSKISPKGVRSDLAPHSTGQEFLKNMKNMRITARRGIEDDYAVLGSELGNMEYNINVSGNKTLKNTVMGVVEGYNTSVVFVHNTDDNKDYIYRVNWSSNNVPSVWEIYSGNLNFSLEYPITGVMTYESEFIQKVYWVDGRNITRSINFAASLSEQSTWKDTSFDFSQDIELEDSIEVDSIYTGGGGGFTSGIIQYAYNYSNVSGQDTHIVNNSDTFYVADGKRGGRVDENISVSYKVTLKDLDKNFDFINLYAIHQTSRESVPVVRKVFSEKIDDSNIISYTDNGLGGESIDPSYLLFVGGDAMIADSIAAKDNTLFLGNIKILKPVVPQRFIDNLKSNMEVVSAPKKIKIQFKVKPYISSITTRPSPYIQNYPYLSSISGSSSEITTFKSREDYRLGIVFQYKDASWSEVVWLGDYRVDTLPHAIETLQEFTGAEFNVKLLPGIDMPEITSRGFKRCRMVVSYPKPSERNCVAQGIICPTMQSVEDGHSDGQVISSWFFRPDVYFQFRDNERTEILDRSFSFDLGPFGIHKYRATGLPELNKVYGIMGNTLQSNHNGMLPYNLHCSCEIQNAMYQDKSTVTPITTLETQDIERAAADYRDKMKNGYYINRNVVTFHTPELEETEFGRNDNGNFNFRIIGAVGISSTASHIEVMTSTPSKTAWTPRMVWSKNEAMNYRVQGGTGIVTAPFWVDYYQGTGLWTHFPLYPWQRTGSLVNSKPGDIPNSQEVFSKLQTKKLANIRYAADTIYFKEETVFDYNGTKNVNYEVMDIYGSPDYINFIPNGISPISIFNGDVDGFRKDQFVGNDRDDNSYVPKSYNYVGNYQKTLVGEFKFPVGAASGTVPKWNTLEEPLKYTGDASTTTSDAVEIAFKSTKHIVFSFPIHYNQSSSGKGARVTTLMPLYYGANSAVPTHIVRKDEMSIALMPDTPDRYWINCVSHEDRMYREVPLGRLAKNELKFNYSIGGNFDERDNKPAIFWLGELYRKDIENKFGGTSTAALVNNTWNIGGKVINLNTLSAGKKIVADQGDAYLQRYDSLKTVPFAKESINQIVDIASFICETFVNVDGRYDRNRGIENNVNMSETNFGLYNKAYTGKIDLFTYQFIDVERFKQDVFPNTVVWSLPKISNDDKDVWTSIRMTSSIELEGDKGFITTLFTQKEGIYAFQKRGLSQILFNSRVQISTSDGIPIELQNSGKVEGFRYISASIGLQNKSLIVPTYDAHYFFDMSGKAMYMFGSNELRNITQPLFCDNLINSIIKDTSDWTPKNKNALKLHYDALDRNLYMANESEALCFSEKLAEFEGIFTFKDILYSVNYSQKFVPIGVGPLRAAVWNNNQKDSSTYYGVPGEIEVSMYLNENFDTHKIYSNVSMIGSRGKFEDFASNTFPFDSIYVRGMGELFTRNAEWKDIGPSSLKNKYDTWMMYFPRMGKYNTGRVRGHWIEMGLKSKLSTNKNFVSIYDLNYSFSQ